MKSTDLMIGDWVYNKNIDKPMQVYPMMLSQMFRRTPDATTEDYNIFPVPLTPEILEKNGFVYDSEDKLFEDIYPRISMLYAQYRLVENGGINYGEMSEIKYVHQLQHALRLCGIDKEIDLNNTEN